MYRLRTFLVRQTAGYWVLLGSLAHIPVEDPFALGG